MIVSEMRLVRSAASLAGLWLSLTGNVAPEGVQAPAAIVPAAVAQPTFVDRRDNPVGAFMPHQFRAP